MQSILRLPKKHLEKKLKDFVKRENINSDDISEWIKLISNFIYEFELTSAIHGEDIFSITTNKEEQLVIEKMLSYVENTKTSLNYVFDGNVILIEK